MSIPSPNGTYNAVFSRQTFWRAVVWTRSRANGQLEHADPMRIQFARFVADNDDFQSIFDFQTANRFNHSRDRFQEREHEASKICPVKGRLG
jgi:hypothetical protein